MKGRLALALLALLLASPSAGHEQRPGYLALRELGGDRYQTTFRVPTREGRALSLRAVLPEECRELGPPSVVMAPGARDTRWDVVCPGGLAGREIRVDGLAATLTDVLVRIERADGTAQVARLLPRAPALRVEAAPGAFDVARTYLALGVEHILLGADHLLFVLALLWVVRGRRQLFAAISAFTVAHSLTLAAATLGLVRVPGPPVEAVIALSIAFLAREIVGAARGRTRAGMPRPWLVAFVFGLLHGLGFAGALREVGLPEQAIPLALLCFNVGVELGQLGFAAAVVVPAAAALRVLPRRPWPAALPGYGIGALAGFWTLERVVGFWS
jgi:hydrogenase/urease accessory protein HupE